MSALKYRTVKLPNISVVQYGTDFSRAQISKYKNSAVSLKHRKKSDLDIGRWSFVSSGQYTIVILMMIVI